MSANAGIQVHCRFKSKGQDSGLHRNDENRSRLPVDTFRTPRLEAEGCSCVLGMLADWEGGSPSANRMEVKASEAQGHPPRGGVWRKRGANARANEQELDDRREGWTS